ncbi:recombinase family protein, partial [Cellulosimicrobium cellulans]
MPHAAPSRNSRRAVTYGRQSRERADKSAASPEAQRQSGLAHVTAQGWEHVEHFEDLGRSGWDPEVERPGLEAALRAVDDGRADVLVVYKLDRLSRAGVAEAVALVERIRRAGGAFASVREPFLDLTDPMGLAIFGIFAALAQQESENISTRTRAAKAVLREAGSHMSGRPPYGHRAEKASRGGLSVRDLVVEPVEASVVREVVRRVLAGESVVSLAADLNARGVKTRSGAAWTTSRLGRLLRSPSIAGYMPAHREGRNASTPRDARGRVAIATDSAGELVQPWEPIVDPAEWFRLLDVLDSRPALRGTNREPSLLGGSGLLRCGHCGGPMVADRRPGGGAYRCSWHRNGKTRASCPGVSVSLAHTDDFVARAVWARAASLADVDAEGDPASLDLLATAAGRFFARVVSPEVAAQRSSLEASIAATTAALYRLDDDRAAGLFDGPLGLERYQRQTEALEARLVAAREGLEALPSDTLDLTPLLDYTGASGGDVGPLDAGGVWEAWDVAERREFLGVFLDRVEV